MNSIEITAAHLEHLRKLAITGGNLHNWSVIAVQWAEQASVAIEKAEEREATLQEQNRLWAERLSRVANALEKASEYIRLQTTDCMFLDRDKAKDEYIKAMKVVNSGLGDDKPPPCATCHGTGIQSRVERVLEREEESKPKPEKGW
jgi:hypothetical protein